MKISTLLIVIFVSVIIFTACATPTPKAENKAEPTSTSVIAQVLPTRTPTPTLTPVSTRTPQVIAGCTLPAGDWFSSTYLNVWREWDKTPVTYEVPVTIPGNKITKLELSYDPKGYVILTLFPSTGITKGLVIERNKITPGLLMLVVPGVNTGDAKNTNRLAGPIYVYSCDGQTLFIDDEYKSRFITTDRCPQFTGWWDWKKMPSQGLVITSEDDEITVSVESVGAESSNLKYVHKDGNEQVFITPNSFDGVIFFGGNQYVHFWTCRDGVYYRRLPKDFAPPAQQEPPSPGKKS